MFNCKYLARGITVLTHLVLLLVKVGSLRPSSSRYLDTIDRPPQTDATEEGVPHFLLVSC